jgi:hypothetical protein
MMNSAVFAGLVALALAGCGGPAGGTGGGPIAVGVPVDSAIGFDTTASTIPGRGASMFRREVWTVSLTTGMPVTILMCRVGSVRFDPYLVVHGPAGAEDNLQSNDDISLETHDLNSRVVYTPTTTGMHTIYATTFSTFVTGSTSGNYRLSVVNGDMPTATCPAN